MSFSIFDCYVYKSIYLFYYMSKNILLEQRARLFLLENMSGNKERYSFSNPEFKKEIEFLESNRYAIKVDNSPIHNYAVTNKGIEFAISEQKPYNS